MKTQTLLIGPFLLAVVTGIQFMLAAWRTWWQRPFGPEEFDRLTLLGRWWYHPDYDIPLYVVGVIETLILMMALSLAWRWQLSKIRDMAQLQSVRWLLWTHFPVSGFFILLPMLWIRSILLAWISAVLALFVCLSLYFASYLKSLSFPTSFRLSKTALMSLELSTVAGLIVLLVYIPDIPLVTGWAFQIDCFHHWDFYAMAPALAFRHGVALGTDFHCQYGVGWPMLLALASTVLPLTYGMAVRFAVVFGCVYFFAEYLFLRYLLKSASWALVGLLLTLLFQLFNGADGPPKWVGPGSTVLRNSLDLLVFAICLAYTRQDRAWLGLLAGATVGLVILFSTDTGIYISAAMTIFLLMLPRLKSNVVGQRRCGFL